MGPDRVVVDISSDEEDFGLDRADGPSSKWVDGLLGRADGWRVEESDEVVLLDEPSAPAVKRRRQNPLSSGPGKFGDPDEDDDDCVVLDSDPDKPIVVNDEKGGDGDGGDDLLIVAEKGQLACRDYPHSRHLCANFPFSSSPHEKHCDLCHCYVCDSPAPCNYWGNGELDTDHCHCTDKEGRWKSLRQSFKQKNLVATHTEKLTDDSFNILFRELVPLCHSNQVPLTSNSLRSCSTRVSNSNAINQRNQYQPSILSRRSQRPGQKPTKSHPRNPRVESHVAALTTQLMNSHARFRRAGSMQAGFTSLNNRSHNTVSSHNHIPMAVAQKSGYAIITSQTSCCPQEGQQRSQDPVVKLPSVLADQMQTTASSQFTLSTRQNSVCPPVTAADVSQKSWQDILASVASELGVSSCSNTGIVDDQRPLIAPSLPCDKSFSETNASLDTQSSPAMTDLSSLDYDCSWSNNPMAQIPEHSQVEDPLLSTFQTSNSVVTGSNTVSGENCLDSFLASIENEIWL